MELKTEFVGPVAEARLSGRFDALSSPAVGAWLESVTTKPPALALVEMSAVTFVDSTALSVLVKGMKRARENGGELVICGLQKQVRVIFELTRLDRALIMTETIEEGRNKLNVA